MPLMLLFFLLLFQFKPSLISAELLFSARCLPRKFFLLPKKLQRLLRFCSGTAFQKCLPDISLHTLRISPFFALFGCHSRTEAHLHVFFEYKFVYLAVFRFCPKNHLCGRQFSGAYLFKHADTERLLKKYRQFPFDFVHDKSSLFRL